MSFPFLMLMLEVINQLLSPTLKIRGASDKIYTISFFQKVVISLT